MLESPLTDLECRILGCLLEKQHTTPDYYPLTANALVAACNQTSNRHPVVAYTEALVQEGLETLRQRHLIWVVSATGSRAVKFEQRLTDALHLSLQEAALLCVLMLRGPQTAGELRGRTERMHEFAEIADVEHCLESLAARTPQPLVASLPRGRWCHLLGGVPDPAQAVEAPATSAAASDFEERIAALEREVAELKQTLESFRRQFE